MNDHHLPTEGCETFRADLGELALGVLPGDDRAAVLEHVARCPACSVELQQLARVVDAMVQLAPEVGPPPGFERRLAERLATTTEGSRPRRSWRPSRIVLVAAAMVIAGAGVAAGHFALASSGNGSSHVARGDLAVGELRSSSGAVQGQVFIARGHPAWLFMNLDSGNWSGAARCTVTLRSGRVETVGSVALSDGYGAWGGPLAAAQDEVRSAALISADGTVLASARL